MNCARAAYFQPTFSKYNNTVVPGVQWLTPQQQSNLQIQFTSSSPFLSATIILRSFMMLANPKDAFQWDGSWFGHPGIELIDDYAGTTLYRNFLNNFSMTPEDINNYFHQDVEDFKLFRKPYLLYT